jgi:Type VI secretion system (T6SS), amidase immunity protein
MATALKLYGVALSFALLFCACPTQAQSTQSPENSVPMTDQYSQKTLLKNWALSVCLAAIAKDADARDDANATASAYLEFGHQKIEAYDALRELALQYAHRKYGGSIKSDFNTMKCIDLFHSKELDRLVTQLVHKG